MNRMMTNGLRLKFAGIFFSVLALAACDGTSISESSSPASTTPNTSTTTGTTSKPASTTSDVTVDPVAFSAASYSASQKKGVVTVTVTRSGTNSDAMSVSYDTKDGTAIGGKDYTPTSGTVQWAESDSSPQTIDIPISTKQPFTGNLAFSIALSDPSPGVSLSDPTEATITVVGDQTVEPGTVQLSATTFSASQAAGVKQITVNRVDGSDGAISVAYSTTNGTAVAGTAYTAAKGVLSWEDGDDAAKTFPISLSNAKPFTGNQTFTIALATPTGGAVIGKPASSTFTIVGDATPPVGTASLSASTYQVGQADKTLKVSVSRTGGSSGAVGVNYSTGNGTAIAGTDYTAVTGTLTWAAGDAAVKTFTVPVSDTAPFMGNKTFSLHLTAPSGGLGIVNPGVATATIAGNGSAPVGTLQLAAPTATIGQAAGSVSIGVSRAGGSNGAISVGYTTANGSAVSGSQYTASSGTLNWADGETATKTINVPISNATPFTGSKSFTVSLTGPKGGATLGSPVSATVSITGDQTAQPTAAGSLKLTASSYAVAQDDGAVTISVSRTGGTGGAVGVTYQTADDTAVAGTDFTGTSGTLQWAAGDAASKTFKVSISDASPFVGTKSFTVSLGSASGGASTASPTSATVTVTGNGTSQPTSGSGSAPQAPTNVQLNTQGLGTPDSALAYLLVPPSPNTTSITWTQGQGAVAKNKVYRSTTSATSGFSLIYTSSSPITSYTDNTATLSSNGTEGSTRPYHRANTYWYKVTAVDAAGDESAQSVTQSYVVFANGTFHWGPDLSYGLTANYKDSSGAIACHVDTENGGFQPTSGWVSPEWNMWAGAFKYFQFDVKPYKTGETWVLGFRLAGDLNPYNQQGQQILVPIGDSSNKYGPQAVAGQWTTYRVPLSDVINDYGASGAGPAEMQNAIYKFLLADQTGQAGVTFYVTNIKFTP